VGSLTHEKTKYYIGQWKKDMRHGVGKNVFDGDIYFGEFRFDLQHGVGQLKTADGDFYEGEWKVGNQDGFGVYHWSDGSSYTGDWKLGNPHGEGIWQNYDILHEGGFVNGVRHGKAKITRKKDGKVLFTGMYKNDKQVKASGIA